MKYEGKLYGKIGKKYFDTGHTTEDLDKLSHPPQTELASERYRREAQSEYRDEADFINELYGIGDSDHYDALDLKHWYTAMRGFNPHPPQTDEWKIAKYTSPINKQEIVMAGGTLHGKRIVTSGIYFDKERYFNYNGTEVHNVVLWMPLEQALNKKG